jgi:DNA-binding NtrC family response regulator
MSYRPYRLLAIDDEPLALTLVSRAFEGDADIEVLSTTSAIRGLEMATSSDFDLILADHRMPEMTGVQFLARIRDLRPHAFRILLNAFPDTGVALKAMNEGVVYRFVLKPWEPEEMRVTVRRALETKRLSDAHERLVSRLKQTRLDTPGRLSADAAEAGSVVKGLLHRVGELEVGLHAVPPATVRVEESLAAIRAAAHRLEALATEIQRRAEETDGAPSETTSGEP